MIAIGVGLAIGVGYYLTKQVLAVHSTGNALPMASVELLVQQTRLKKMYDEMETALMERNLNVDFIESISGFYGVDAEGKGGGSEIKALPYPSPNVCRLLVLPMDHFPKLTAKLATLSTSIMDIMPKNFKVYQNVKERFHVTLFHTSRVESPVPPDTEPDQHIAMEKEQLGRIVTASRAPSLLFDRIVLADSGVLLALWIDETKVCFNLRKQSREAFPDAPSKQTNILHSSLFRILTPEALPLEIREELTRQCKEANKALKGTKWRPSKCRLVHESHFSTIEGQFFDFPFQENN